MKRVKELMAEVSPRIREAWDATPSRPETPAAAREALGASQRSCGRASDFSQGGGQQLFSFPAPRFVPPSQAPPVDANRKVAPFQVEPRRAPGQSTAAALARAPSAPATPRMVGAVDFTAAAELMPVSPMPLSARMTSSLRPLNAGPHERTFHSAGVPLGPVARYAA